MTKQNRVLPSGEIVALPIRGLFMGNRGRIHTESGGLGLKRWTRLGWVTCRLEFQGRKRQIMGDGYTELFFFDEAVALAAGHRPCAECRRPDYEAFQRNWRSAFGARASAHDLDRHMQADRVDSASRQQRRYEASLDELPSGVFIALPDGRAGLVIEDNIFPLSVDRYDPPIPRAPGANAVVLTPRCTVAVLKAGYRPCIHPSAMVQPERRT
jgi:hypothetical protein